MEKAVVDRLPMKKRKLEEMTAALEEDRTAAKEEAPTVCQYGAAAAAAAAAASSPPEWRVSTEEAADVPAPAVGRASCLIGSAWFSRKET